MYGRSPAIDVVEEADGGEELSGLVGKTSRTARCQVRLGVLVPGGIRRALAGDFGRDQREVGPLRRRQKFRFSYPRMKRTDGEEGQ